MDIFLCTKNRTVEAAFESIRKGKAHTLTLLSPADLPARIKKLPDKSLFYLDISAFQEGEEDKLLRRLMKEEGLRIGIIDPRQTIKDPASLFHSGAVDYIPKPLISETLQPKRITAALATRPFPAADNHNNHTVLKKENWIVLPRGWTGVQNGKEYSFFFLYVEIDMLDEWKKKSGSTHINSILETFHRHIEAAFKPCGGKIWMWMNNSGLVLFPFDGQSCPCIEACLRLILNRRISTLEEYKYDTLITYTMALHLGNTVYKTRGETGEIISDSINFLFHVGKKYAQPEHFYITENVMPFLSPGIEELCTENGSFEGVRMFSMKLPRK